MEAAAIGRPIISTDVTGSREIAINNYNSVNIKIENKVSNRDKKF